MDCPKEVNTIYLTKIKDSWLFIRRRGQSLKFLDIHSKLYLKTENCHFVGGMRTGARLKSELSIERRNSEKEKPALISLSLLSWKRQEKSKTIEFPWNEDKSIQILDHFYSNIPVMSVGAC